MTTTAPQPYQLSPEHRRVFVGLLLGMFVASISQTIVGPAMPQIVAELGGMAHYSWVATAAMLVSAITVPVVGKLSDLYGRRGFYLAGIVVFMVGAVIAGLAPSFWVLVGGRAVQGLGMGILMPLSQTIVGDIIPARQRGKYQGLMGAVFGVTSVAGPLAGGLVTDHFGWRWLFFAALPVGVVALVIISRFLHLDFERRDARVDVPGIVTLSLGLTAVLLAVSWGGTTYPWVSGQILGLAGAGLALLVAFVFIELRSPEPVLPLALFRNSIFTWSNVASFGLSMAMFGAIIYIPIYAQGVLGVDATGSGLILMPLMLAMIVLGILSGMVITRTGRYKELMLVGVVLAGAGFLILSRMDADSTATTLTVAMLLLGMGLGMAQQQYTLLVQNAVGRRDLGVATAATQFFRNVGATIGIAVFGTIMTSGMAEAVLRHLPDGAAAEVPDIDVGAVLDPSALADLPEQVATAIRHGLADQLHAVFLVGLPIVGLVLAATLAIKVIPLRDTVHSPEDARREYLDTMALSAPVADEVVPGLARGDAGGRTRERLLGQQLELLCESAERPENVLLRRAVTELGDGDLARGLALLAATSRMLTTDDAVEAARAEAGAVAVARRAARDGGLLSAELRKDLAVVAARADRGEVLGGFEVTVDERHEAVDVGRLFQAAAELNFAVLADARGRVPTGGDDAGGRVPEAGADPRGRVPDRDDAG